MSKDASEGQERVSRKEHNTQSQGKDKKPADIRPGVYKETNGGNVTTGGGIVHGTTGYKGN